MTITCYKLSAAEWVEEEYKFIKPPEMDKKTFEEEAKKMLGWDEDVEMEIEFMYALEELCYVTFRKRVK